MTKISIYKIDQNIQGNDKWIGSDAQSQNTTKNFTPSRLADYFNENNVIDIGNSVRYMYDTIDITSTRQRGTISFETEIGPIVNFSDISTFILSKYSLKGNDVSSYVNFLIDSYVIISKSSDINSFGYYKVTSIEPYIVDDLFFVINVDYIDGNGFISEDLDYLISLVDKSSGGDVPTLTSELTNDGDDGINPFISLADLPYQIEIYPDVESFPLVGQDELIYFAEYPGTFYLWNGETSSYDQITSNAFPTGLERITEGANTGWRLIGRNRTYYGPIGMGAVDLSYSNAASEVLGATGANSFAVGQSVRASGQGSAAAGGNNNNATGTYSFIGGGSQSDASGNNTSVMSGYFAKARSFCEHVIGSYNTDYTPTSTTTVSPTDRSLVVGAGTIGNLKDVLTVYKNGAVKFFVEALANITNGAAGFFTFNSTDSNRPYVHNGTEWKGLAYVGEGGTQNLNEVLAVGNTANLKDAILVSDGIDDFGNFIAELEASNVKTRQTYQGFEVINEYGLTRLLDSRIIREDTLGNSTLLEFTDPTGAGTILIPDVVNSTETLALLSDIPTNTSDLVNDGEDGVHPYITLLDLPSNLILYPTTVASDVVGYVKLVTDIQDVDYNVTAVDVSTGSITTTNQLVASLITVPDLISGNPGVFNISTVGNIRRSAGSGTAEFYFNVYKRDSLGTETLIGVSNPTLPPSSAVYAQFNATAIWDDGIFTATDRIVLKFYGSRISGGSNPTYEFQFGGLTPVRTLVPIPLSVVPSIPNATEAVAGIAEIATTEEVTTGTDDERIVTPLKLKQVTDNYMQVILNCNVLGTTVNGGTNIVLYQVDVPANTFSDLDAFEIEGLSAKIGTTASSTIRIWTDTASTFNSGTAQLLAVSASLGANNLFQTIKRELHVRGETVKVLKNTVGIATDEATSTLAANSWASYTFNPAVANTLYLTVTGNAADTFTKQNYKITRYKNKSTI